MAGLDAFGVKLERSDMGSPAVFTPIANIIDISSPELSRVVHDMTAHDSPSGWREKKGGLKDGGEFTVNINYDPGDHDLIINDLDDEDPRDYRLVWPDGIGSWEFRAILSGFVASAPHDDKLTAEITFAVDSKPTIVTGP